ncbi:MAG: insulinase family protein [Ginsengibacter sp.]
MKKILSIALLLFCFQLSNSQTKIDRTKQPQAGPAPVISIKDPVIFKMSNGITVLVVENHKLPKVNAILTIDMGPTFEGDKIGEGTIMGQMLNEGTKTMDKETFDNKVEIMGADLSLYSTGGSVSALTRYFKPAFVLFADAIRNPAFPEASFEKLKSQTLVGLKSQEKSASAIAGRLVNALNYGKNTPLGEFETEQSINSITLADIKDTYKNYITPSRSYLTFTGDITPEEAKKIATETLGSWTGKALTLPVMPPGDKLAKTEIDIIDVPSAVQAQLFVTNLIENPMTNPDFFGILLANQILGGGSDGKLFQNLREKHGFTYGSYSNIGSGRFGTMVSSSAQVRNEKADSAVAEIIAELNNMRSGNFTQADLDLAKAKFNGSFAINMENPAIAATYASNILINNLPKDFYRTYLQKINAVTLGDIKNVAQKYISTGGARIIIVGNAEQIMPNLKRLNLPVKSFDAFGNPVTMDAAAPVKVDPNVTAEKVIANYIQAIGGKEVLDKINSSSANISVEMMGQKLGGTMKKMAPYSNAMEMSMNGMTVYKMAFDGTQGYQGQMGQKAAMTSDEIKDQKDEKGIFPQLFYSGTEFKLMMDGTAKVNGEDAYKIKVTKPSGKISTEYYSIKSGLLLKQVSTVTAQGKEMEQSAEFSDYQKVDGIMTPMSIKQTAGGQEIPMTLSDVKYNAGVTAEDFK